MKKRTTRTFSIDDETYEKFKVLINDNKLNQSKLIEGLIIDWMMTQK